MTEALHLKRKDMIFLKMDTDAGEATKCALITPEISKSIGASMHTFNGCSIESTTKYDQALLVLEGTVRIRTGENYSRVIEATSGDVIWLPKGTRLKYEGESAKSFSALYPVDWRTREPQG